MVNLLFGVCALLMSLNLSFTDGGVRLSDEMQEEIDAVQSVTKGTYEVDRFELPEEAAVLVVVEGVAQKQCVLSAYEKTENGWEKRLDTDGWFGHNGLSSNRTMGDMTTPIGVFEMNTPFGQKAALEGFPENYIQVDSGYVWEDDTNRLTRDLTKEGERVGTSGYSAVYQYAVDMGFNRNAVYKKGSALFLHCAGVNEDGTSGCVAIPEGCMIEVLRLYGKYGDGRCFIALAPAGTFDLIYDSYGVNNGLSPDGDFSGAALAE